MKPVEFPGQNLVFAKDQPEYQPLPALVVPGAQGVVITCWEMTQEELQEVIRTKRVYLQQSTFNKPLQPIYMTVGLDDLANMELGG